MPDFVVKSEESDNKSHITEQNMAPEKQERTYFQCVPTIKIKYKKLQKTTILTTCVTTSTFGWSNKCGY